jgi:hypothetical protein
MDEFGPHGLWKGKNFVFDRRGAMAPDGEEGYGMVVIGGFFFSRGVMAIRNGLRYMTYVFDIVIRKWWLYSGNESNFSVSCYFPLQYCYLL